MEVRPFCISGDSPNVIHLAVLATETGGDVLRDVLDGIRAQKKALTINDLYNLWVQLKRGLKDNTFKNYQYMYNTDIQ